MSKQPLLQNKKVSLRNYSLKSYSDDIDLYQNGIEALFNRIKERKFVDAETIRLIKLFGKNSMKVGSMLTKYNYLEEVGNV